MQTYEALKESVKRADGHDLSLTEWQLAHGIDQAFLAKKGRHMDSNESLAVVRSLTQFLNTVYSVKIHADLKFQQVLPLLVGGVAAGARKIGWYTQEDIGSIDFLSNGAGDLKTLNLTRDEKTIDIKIAGGRITWTWQEIESAMYQGIPLPTDLGTTARRLVDLFHDTVTAKGDVAYKVEGLLTGLSSKTDHGDISWSGLSTINDKVDKVQSVIRKVATATSQTFTAGICAMPPAYYQELEDAAYGDNKDKTALDYLEYTYRRRGLKIIEWQQLASVTMAAESLTAKDMILALPFTPEAVENLIVEPFLMFPPKEDPNYNVSAGVFTKTAGVAARQPKSVVWAKLN